MSANNSNVIQMPAASNVMQSLDYTMKVDDKGLTLTFPRAVDTISMTVAEFRAWMKNLREVEQYFRTHGMI